MPASPSSRCDAATAGLQPALRWGGHARRRPPALARSRPAIVVLDLHLVGELGLRLIALGRVVEPAAQIVVLTPMETLAVAAVEAGADVAVGDRDPVRLRTVLEELAQADARP